MKIFVHILSDLSTPHNNSLVKELRKNKKSKIIAWYRFRKMKELPWEKGLAIDKDDIYFDNISKQMNLIYKIIFSRKSKFLIIGYSNYINRFAILWFAMTFREYYFWLDHPEKRSGLKKIIRKISYTIINYSVAKCLTIGEPAKEFLYESGIRKDKICNFSLYIDVPHNEELLSLNKKYLKEKIKVANKIIVATAASRLTKEKGFHVLIRSLSRLREELINKFKLVIIGSGPYKEDLVHLSRELKLDNHIIFMNWKEPDEYKKILHSSDIFIHPSIFDAYGAGSIYAMSMAVPVIGSLGAGAVKERLYHNYNGLLYEPDDEIKLARHIEDLIKNENLRITLSKNARKSSFNWTSQIGAKRLFKILNIDTMVTHK